MLKWVFTLMVAVLVLGLMAPSLTRRLRIGRLPGDVTLHWRGRTYPLPFTTTLLLSLLLTLIARFI